MADLDKLMAPEIHALYHRRKELNYWNSVKEELSNDVDPRDVSRRTDEIEKRKRQIIRELVGADLMRERMLQQGEEDFLERRLSFLPEDRRTTIREVLEKYSEVRRSVGYEGLASTRQLVPEFPGRPLGGIWNSGRRHRRRLMLVDVDAWHDLDGCRWVLLGHRGCGRRLDLCRKASFV